MPINPSIPMQFQGIDMGAIMERAQRMQQQRYEMKRKHEADQRDDEYRNALGDVLTGNGGFAQQQPMQEGQSPAQAIGAPSAGPSAQDRAARANPEGYLKFQGQQTQLTEHKLKQYRDVNNMGMQLLGGVHDDATLQAAKAQARQLYAQYGLDPSAIDKIPDQYTPELVHGLQMQGMDTAHQLGQVARENKLNWDIADDQEDNDRADRLAGSTIEDRNGRRELIRQRVQIAREKANGGGGGKGAKPPASEQALYTSIRSKWMNGGQINPREKAWAEDYERRRNARGASKKGGGKKASLGEGAVIRLKDGTYRKQQGGNWVPANAP